MEYLARYWGLFRTAPPPTEQHLRAPPHRLIEQAVLTLCPHTDCAQQDIQKQARTLTHPALLYFMEDLQYEFESYWMVCEDHPSFKQWSDAMALLDKVDRRTMPPFLARPEVVEILPCGKERIVHPEDVTPATLISYEQDPDLSYCITPSTADKGLFNAFRENVGLTYPPMHPDIQLCWDKIFTECQITDAQLSGDWETVANSRMQLLWGWAECGV